MKNIFVIGLTNFQRKEIEALPDADEYVVHGLLDSSVAISGRHLFMELLDKARKELAQYSFRPDAIIAHWDFPTSVLVPILCEEYGLPSPTLESILKCEHKYWSRLEQSRSIPECTPGFNAFDPFDDDPFADINIDFPFWVKPVKAFSSQLGFRIDDPADFSSAVTEIRKSIRLMGDTFDEVLSMIELPDEVSWTTGHTCIAEEIIEGRQSAPEGSVFGGRYGVHGVIDMVKDPHTNSFDKLTYPSTMPEHVQQKMIRAAEKFLSHIGFDNGCFNAEFMWDEQRARLMMVEVNTRISQSHVDFFYKVDGVTNHLIAIQGALGQRPQMPHGEGKYQAAAKCLLRHTGEALVTRVPDESDLRRLKGIAPGSNLNHKLEPGMRLSELSRGLLHLGSGRNPHPMGVTTRSGMGRRGTDLHYPDLYGNSLSCTRPVGRLRGRPSNLFKELGENATQRQSLTGTAHFGCLFVPRGQWANVQTRLTRGCNVVCAAEPCDPLTCGDEERNTT